MNKKIVLLVIIFLIGIVSIIFFNQNKEDYYLTYANKVIDLYEGKYNTDGIKKRDLKAFDTFYDKLRHKNETIDITDYFTFNDENKASGNPALKASYTNGKCFIKYDDLTLWNNYNNAEEGTEIFQRVTCNGYETILFETAFTPPYDVLVNDPKYNFVIDSYEKGITGYNFKYKSTYDGTPLKLSLIMEDKAIVKIEVTYD